MFILAIIIDLKVGKIPISYMILKILIIFIYGIFFITISASKLIRILLLISIFLFFFIDFLSFFAITFFFIFFKKCF